MKYSTLQGINRKASLLLIVAFALLFASCSSDDDDTPSLSAESQTLFFYFPWTNNLTSCLYDNISDVKSCITTMAGDGRVLENERIVVFMSTSASEAKMYEIVYSDGACTEENVAYYHSPALTTAEGIAGIINDMKAKAPAQRYGMIIGSHGRGWVRVDDWFSARAMRSPRRILEAADEHPLTRYFGGTQMSTATDVSTLAEAISMSQTKFEFLLFDACYMANIESVYDLRSVVEHVLACPTEVMKEGMPYKTMLEHMLGTVDYEAIADDFYEFYSNESGTYGTFSVTDCSELDELAQIMRDINSLFTLADSLRGRIQKFDGENETIFYDLGHYVETICTNDTLLEEFRQQMDNVVLHGVYTTYYPYSKDYQLRLGRVDHYSGLTTSAPSVSRYTGSITTTNWYVDTH